MQTAQVPIGTKYGHFTEPEEVMQGVDLHGKVAVVTGGYTSIGLWTTKMLLAAGAQVTVLARDVKRAKRNLRKVSGVEIIYFDLLKPKSIDEAAEIIIKKHEAIDILVNSAGIIGIPLRRDARGYEYQLATNHLGHFQLTTRLYPALQRAKETRVVMLSSRGHRWGGMDFTDPNFIHRTYTPNEAYAQSKTAIALFAVQLNALCKKDNVHAYAVHPGPIPSSDLFAESAVGVKPKAVVMLRRVLAKFMRGCRVTQMLNFLRRPQVGDAYKTIKQGASTVLWCATDKRLVDKGGVYIEDCDIAPLVAADSELPYGVRPWAVDEPFAKQCWALSEELTGIHFEI